MSSRSRASGVAAVLAALLLTAACGHDGGTDARPGQRPTNVEPPLPRAYGVAALPEGPYVGIAVSAIEADAINPYAGDSAAVEQGRTMFVSLNCTGCHGFEAKTGLFAPNLTDNFWRYGSSDADVYNSIYEGRAKGMPAWGAVLEPQQIWMLTAYLRSLGGMTPPRVPSMAAYTNTQKARMPVPQNKAQP